MENAYQVSVKNKYDLLISNSEDIFDIHRREDVEHQKRRAEKERVKEKQQREQEKERSHSKHKESSKKTTVLQEKQEPLPKPETYPIHTEEVPKPPSKREKPEKQKPRQQTHHPETGQEIEKPVEPRQSRKRGPPQPQQQRRQDTQEQQQQQPQFDNSIIQDGSGERSPTQRPPRGRGGFRRGRGAGGFRGRGGRGGGGYMKYGDDSSAPQQQQQQQQDSDFGGHWDPAKAEGTWENKVQEWNNADAPNSGNQGGTAGGSGQSNSREFGNQRFAEQWDPQPREYGGNSGGSGGARRYDGGGGGGFDRDAGEGGFVRRNEFGGGFRGRGRGVGRGGPRGGGRGGFGTRGGGRPGGRGFGGRRREFERHSGSDKTGVRPHDKKDGSGTGNWGSHEEEIKEGEAELAKTEGIEEYQNNDAADATVGETRDEGEAPETTTEGNAGEDASLTPNADAQADENITEEDQAVPAEVEMTLDEWKALQSKERFKQQQNLRKAGEGEDDAKWKDAFVLHKTGGQRFDAQVDLHHEDEHVHMSRDIPALPLGRCDVPIQLRFTNSPRRGGPLPPGAGMSSRGMAGRGGSRSNYGSDRGHGGDRSGGRGRRGGGRSDRPNRTNDPTPTLDDDNFPTLTKEVVAPPSATAPAEAVA